MNVLYRHHFSTFTCRAFISLTIIRICVLNWSWKQTLPITCTCVHDCVPIIPRCVKCAKLHLLLQNCGPVVCQDAIKRSNTSKQKKLTAHDISMYTVQTPLTRQGHCNTLLTQTLGEHPHSIRAKWTINLLQASYLDLKEGNNACCEIECPCWCGQAGSRQWVGLPACLQRLIYVPFSPKSWSFPSLSISSLFCK